MHEHEYVRTDALGLAALVRRGDVTASELLELAIRRIERLNPSLNAVVHPMYDDARRTMSAVPADAPFAGVPFLIKDLLAWYEGVRITSGSRLYRDFKAPYDSELVRRYKAAGCVIMGKTNTPEFGLTPFTESRFLGRANNPWDHARTTGGSSGGSGAAVAARMVPMASGGDGGGSLRIPASCNGVFSIKPTRGRVPTGPLLGELWHGAVVEGVLSVSVRDSAAMLDAIAGGDPGAPYEAVPPTRPYLDELSRAPRPLTIGVTTHPALGRSLHPDCAAAVQHARTLLESLGHRTVDVSLTVDRELFNRSFMVMICAEVAADLEDARRLLGREPHRDEVEPATWALGMLGKSLSAAEYAMTIRDLQRSCRPIGRLFESMDLLLTPTLAAPPILHGALQPPARDEFAMKLLGAVGAGGILKRMGALEQAAETVFDWIPFTPLFNVTGQPAMSLPLYWNADGLPIGVQCVGRYGDESTLFALAGQLETAQPWRERIPPGCGTPTD